MIRTMRKQRMWIPIGLLCIGLLMLLGYPVLAAEQGEGHEPAFDPWKELARFFNFAVIVIVLYLLLRKRISAALQNRQSRIEKAIEDSQKAVAEAEAQLRSHEERVRNLDTEIAQIKQQGAEEREALLQRMEADARTAADRIVQNARLNIEQEVEKAKASLQAEAADLAIRLAEDLLKTHMQEADHQRLVQRYLTQIGGETS
ncbi:MAG: hypothetical protein D6736_16305 [Nitrospinota bacterium]|nr:MAG: hypothetical protein D6736_16305 [Nitrospinota bacterium]